jgi:protein gp37
LFHDDVPLPFIKKVFQTMNETPHHTYQVLTKRADRVLDLSS